MARYFLIAVVALFSLLGCIAWVKKFFSHRSAAAEMPVVKKSSAPCETAVVTVPATVLPGKNPQGEWPSVKQDDFPQIDRIFQLFTLGSSKFPIVETVTYASAVPWLNGRPAWLADYASHFNTSRHFIARSLNGKADYFSQKIVEGGRFNVFRRDKRIHFYLLVDVSRCKMGFYYVDLDTNERVLIKTYVVGLGKPEARSASGTLTPLGRYSLGNRIAVYTPGVEGYYHDQKVEMVCVFGTRWIPFDQEVDRVSAPAKGYGLQGVPWTLDQKKGQYVENRHCLGAYESDGCIRLAQEDIEEIFSIVITKPTFIEIVKDFREAKLPGMEVAGPSR